MEMLAAGLGEAAGQDPQQLVEVRAQRAVGRLLDAQVLEHGDGIGTADATRRGADQFLVDATALGVVGNRHLAKRVTDSVGAVDMVGQKLFVAKVFLHQHRGHRRETPGVRPRPHPKVNVCHLGRVREHRIDDDHRAGRIFGNLVENRSGSGEALRHPRVLADEDGDLGVLELAARVAAVQVRVNPRFSGFLLRQRI
jgi:hypothetical protein